MDTDGLAQLYDTEIALILDRLVPVLTVQCRRRASDALFDDDCHSAKRSVRLLESDIRRIRRRNPSNTAAISHATAVWFEIRRDYRVVLRHKRDILAG